MIELRISGQAVDLDPRTVITIEQNNPAYLGEDIDVLPGEFSYPFTLPLTNHNRRIIGYLDRIDSTSNPTQLAAQLYLNANLHIDGTIYISRPSNRSVKVYLVSNSLLSIKDKSIRDVTERRYTLPQDLAAHMLTVSTSPDDYEYGFFPVYNPSIADGDDYAPSRWHNTFRPESSTFSDVGAISPFPRLHIVLADVMAATGFTFVNAWQDETLLKRLYLVHNLDLRTTNTEIERDVPLRNLLPDWKCNELLKGLCRMFCLAPFPDYPRRTITLRPLQDLLRLPAQRDWTEFAGEEMGYTVGQSAVSRHEFGSGAYSGSANMDDVTAWQSDEAQGNIITDAFGDIGYENLIDDRYYEHSTGRIFRPLLDLSPADEVFYIRKSTLGRHFGAVDNENGEEINSVSLYPMFTEWADIPEGFVRWTVPAWSQNPVKFGEKPAARLAFFYGNAVTGSVSAYPYPYGGWTPYGYITEQIPGATYSLGWEGPYGLYEKWWEKWDSMLQSGKMVTRNFLLTPQEINRFTFDQKVRVHSKEYFVRSMRYQVSLRGISEVQVKMMTIS